MTKQRRGTPFTMDADNIARYVRGIAETHPRHTDATRADFSAPPLCVATVVIPTSGMMLGDIDLGGLNIARIVHGSIELRFERMVRKDDVLTCVASYEGMEDKSSGTLINFGFEVEDAEGAATCRGVTRYFVRAKRQAGAAAIGKGGTDTPAPAGALLHMVSETVPPEQSLRYAEGSGDVFPIHTSTSFARSVGLPDVILHGMCTLAFSTRAVVDNVLGGDATRLRSLSARFSRMVFHGDTLTTRIGRDPADATALWFDTLNQGGERVLEHGRVTYAA